MSTTTTLTYENTSRFVQAGDVRMHFHEAGSGPVLLCIHGGAPGAFGWGNLGRNMQDLAQHFRVLVVDLPGYGQSAKPEVAGGRNAFYARTMCAMLQALDIPRAHILGMATGGAVGIRMAVDSPEVVDHLVLVSSAGGTGLYQVKGKETASQAYYGGSGPSFEKMRAYLERQMFDPRMITDEIVRERYDASVAPEFMVRAPEGRSAQRHTPDTLWKDIDRIRARTLIVWGRENRAQNMENAVFMLSRIPDAQLHIFGQCGLWVPYEKMAEFNALVLRFLG